MKNITILLITVLSLFSCGKQDTINHYLIKPITQKELIDNGFYKYSYTDTIDNKDKIKDTVRLIIRYDMYSNVKPEKNEDKEIYPTQLVRFSNLDTVQQNKRISYRKKELNDRIITYVFRNNVLFYKDIIVYSVDKSQKKIADFTSKEKIIKYYRSIKIPIEPIFDDRKNKEYPRCFLIDNYRVHIDYSEKEQFYEFFINYINDDFYRNTIEDCYSGQLSKIRYYL
jgi:hypothetical protein